MNRWFVNHGNPWFHRGHAFHGGGGAGVFAFYDTNGTTGVGHSFRVVPVLL